MDVGDRRILRPPGDKAVRPQQCRARRADIKGVGKFALRIGDRAVAVQPRCPSERATSSASRALASASSVRPNADNASERCQQA